MGKHQLRRVNLQKQFADRHWFWHFHHVGKGLRKNLKFQITLSEFLFTASETELDYHLQNVNVRVASWDAEWLTIGTSEKENFKKIPKMFGFDSECPASLLKSRKKSCAKRSIEKPNLLDFVNLSAAFCPRLLVLHVFFRKKTSQHRRREEGDDVLIKAGGSGLVIFSEKY